MNTIFIPWNFTNTVTLMGGKKKELETENLWVKTKTQLFKMFIYILTILAQRLSMKIC